MIAIIEDAEVGKTAQHVFQQMGRASSQGLNEQLENFWTFLSVAAELPDKRPAGVCGEFVPGEVPDFFTPARVAGELREIKKASELLLRRLTENRDIVLFGEIGALVTLLEEFNRSEQLNDPNNDSLPQMGKSAGKNNLQNELLRGLFVRAHAHLGGEFPTFCREVHRVLLGLEAPMEPSTARRMSVGKSRLAIE